MFFELVHARMRIMIDSHIEMSVMARYLRWDMLHNLTGRRSRWLLVKCACWSESAGLRSYWKATHRASGAEEWSSSDIWNMLPKQDQRTLWLKIAANMLNRKIFLDCFEKFKKYIVMCRVWVCWNAERDRWRVCWGNEKFSYPTKANTSCSFSVQIVVMGIE